MRHAVVCLLLAAASFCGASPLNPYPAQNPGQSSVGITLSQLQCNIIPSVNASNIDTLKNDATFAGQIAQYSCPLNRGVFVIQKPGYENHTYSCTDFPKQWCKDPTKCAWPNILADNSGQDLVDIINLWFEGMFNSSIEKHPADCTFDAYGSMSCPNVRKEEPWKTAPWVDYLGHEPIRGVNIGGLFVLEPWINQGFAEWGDNIRDQMTYSKDAQGTPDKEQKLKDHWKTWYTQDDFTTMRNTMKLNTVRLPLGWWYFAADAGVQQSDYLVPDEAIDSMDHPINKVMQMAQKAGLKVIVDLHGAPCSQNGLDNSGNKSMETNQDLWGDDWLYHKECMDNTHVVLDSISKWIVETLPRNGVNDTVIMLELVNEPWVFSDISLVRDFYLFMLDRIRNKQCTGECPPSYWTYRTLPLLFHDAFRHFPWTWLLRHVDLTNVFLDTHLYHAFNIADVASDNEACDRQKMTITENIACQYGGLLSFKSCTSLPVFVGEWSLAIDNCMGLLNGSPGTSRTRNSWDAGQCRDDALRNRTSSPWWQDHMKSFANRQMYTFEQQLGWSFWTWKVDDTAKKDPSSNWWSFTQAYQQGYITVPYAQDYLGGCSTLQVVPDCTESNQMLSSAKQPVLHSDIRNLRGPYW
eukprot:TRINITY_DN290_c1_g1_i1.p2 TRINITY_DN290_c1_g1~~TRINITY_DN290_c1_g1_i1.p2  ORF type:complete len:657 (+),score=287.77 TRINITY_DN290_c1_g1_i1:65-1972(+)